MSSRSSLPRRTRGVLFDLDGTLVDTAPDMVAVLADLQEAHGLERIPYDAGRAHVSNGAIGLLRLAFPEVPADALGPLHSEYLDRYAQALCVRSALFPGLGRLLDALDVACCPWGVVTNKPGWLTDPLLDRLGLYERACCVVSGDTVAERKPHPLPLLHAAQATGVSPAHCVYVGDAERDIVAGRAAGMQTVVAAYGYLSAEDQPLLWNPHGVVERPEEVLDWLTLRHLATSEAP